MADIASTTLITHVWNLIYKFIRHRVALLLIWYSIEIIMPISATCCYPKILNKSENIIGNKTTNFSAVCCYIFMRHSTRIPLITAYNSLVVVIQRFIYRAKCMLYLDFIINVDREHTALRYIKQLRRRRRHHRLTIVLVIC